MKLLCADDEPDLRTILELALSIDPGLDVEIVSSGAELLERASQYALRRVRARRDDAGTGRLRDVSSPQG